MRLAANDGNDLYYHGDSRHLTAIEDGGGGGGGLLFGVRIQRRRSRQPHRCRGRGGDAMTARDKLPDVAGAVASLLAAGHTPHDIERAVVTALRQQARHWSRTESGDWYEIHVCRACGQRDFFHCPKGAPDAAGARVWCGSAGERKREEVTLAAWEAGQPAEVAAVAAVAKAAPPVVDLFAAAGVQV